MGIRKMNSSYFIDYRDPNGRRVIRKIGPDKKEAEAVLGKIQGEIREGRYLDRKRFPKITMDDLIDRYSAWAKGKKSFEGYDAVHLAPIREYFRGMLASRVSELDVETFKARRRDTPTRYGGKRSLSTCRHELVVLKGVFSKGVAWNLVEKNTAAGVKAYPVPKARARFLTAEEVGRLLRCASPHLVPILIFALETGCRRSEIIGDGGVRWGDIDLGRRVIYIRSSKNGDPRHVPISTRLHRMLSSIPRGGESDYIFTGQGKVGKAGIPFHDVRTSFGSACRRAGLEGVRFHDLRRTAASHWVMAGVPMKTVGQILGHRSTAVTDQVYAHLTEDHLLAAVEKLPDWFVAGGRKEVDKRGQKTSGNVIPWKEFGKKMEGKQAALREGGPQRLEKMVGMTGFEPATPWSRTRCSTRLSHIPMERAIVPTAYRAVNM